MRRANDSLDRGRNRSGQNRSGQSRNGQYDVELTLERARGAREPSVADKQRVLASLRDRLGSTPSWPPAEQDITGVRRAVAEGARGPAARLSRLFGRSVKGSVALQRLVLIGAVTGALGFWLGSRDGEERATASLTSSATPQTSAASDSVWGSSVLGSSVSGNPVSGNPVSSSPVSGSGAYSPAMGSAAGVGPELANTSSRSAAWLPRSWATPDDGDLPFRSYPAAPGALQALAPSSAATQSRELSPVTATPTGVGATAAPANRGQGPLASSAPLPASPAIAQPANTALASPAAMDPDVPSGARRDRSVRERAARNGSQRPSGARAQAAAPKFASQPFLEAVRLLQRAQRAVDGGEPALAMFLLGELDTRFPRELLSEERGATRVLALCENGETDRAHQVALELNLLSPTSIYAARIARSCVSLAGGPGVSP